MSTQIGNTAESAAADYLDALGYTVIERNWRTRVCEIDIVAQKQTTIYFVEVKYRQGAQQGRGLDYITPAKLKQMEFAAQCWVQEHSYEGDYELSAIEVMADFQVSEFIPELS